MLKPICVKCLRFYRPKKNGVRFLEGMPRYGGDPRHLGLVAPPGTEAPELWKPYKLWIGDLWVCHGCGHEIISGVGHRPIAVQHEVHFADDVARHRPILQVNDC